MNTLILSITLVLAAGLNKAHATEHYERASEPQHKNIVEIASEAGAFNTLVAAVKAAGLVETLSGDGPFTVFAPTDEAFAALGGETLDALLLPENRDKLTAILTYHVVPGRIEASDLLRTSRARTVNGKRLPVGLRVGEARIIETDIEASNGIIHVIDRVLIPERLPETMAAAAQIIQTAIERGVPLYNNGQPGACAAVYEVAARAILQLDTGLPSAASRPLRRALQRMERTHDQDDRAWILREGLDQSLAAFSSRRMMTLTSSNQHE